MWNFRKQQFEELKSSLLPLRGEGSDGESGSLHVLLRFPDGTSKQALFNPGTPVYAIACLALESPWAQKNLPGAIAIDTDYPRATLPLETLLGSQHDRAAFIIKPAQAAPALLPALTGPLASPPGALASPNSALTNLVAVPPADVRPPRRSSSSVAQRVAEFEALSPGTPQPTSLQFLTPQAGAPQFRTPQPSAVPARLSEVLDSDKRLSGVLDSDKRETRIISAPEPSAPEPSAPEPAVREEAARLPEVPRLPEGPSARPAEAPSAVPARLSEAPAAPPARPSEVLDGDAREARIIAVMDRTSAPRTSVVAALQSTDWDWGLAAERILDAQAQTRETLRSRTARMPALDPLPGRPFEPSEMGAHSAELVPASPPVKCEAYQKDLCLGAALGTLLACFTGVWATFT